MKEEMKKTIRQAPLDEKFFYEDTGGGLYPPQKTDAKITKVGEGKTHHKFQIVFDDGLKDTLFLPIKRTIIKNNIIFTDEILDGNPADILERNVIEFEADPTNGKNVKKEGKKAFKKFVKKTIRRKNENNERKN